MMKYEDFEEMVISLLTRGNSRFKHGSVIVHSIFGLFHIVVECSPSIRDPRRMLVLPNQLLC